MIDADQFQRTVHISRSSNILYVHNSAKIGGANRVVLGFLSKLNRSRFTPMAILPSNGPMEVELKALEVPYEIIDVLGSSTSATRLQQLCTISRLIQYLISHEIKIVHPQGPLSFRYFSFIKRLLKTKAICHLHYPCSAPEDVRWAFRAFPDLFIACSHSVKKSYEQILKQIRITQTQTTVVPNFVDENWYTPDAKSGSLRSELQFGDGTRIISIIGQLSDRKGQNDFLQMAARLSKEDCRIRFLVIGDDIATGGAKLLELKRQAQDLELRDKVFFLGFRNDIRDIINASDVIVLPSQEEGMPMSLLEAAACAKPVVAYDIPGVDEIVGDGVTGYLVQKCDIQQLTSRVRFLMENEKHRQQMGRCARQNIVEQYTLTKFVARIEVIYQSFLEPN